MAKLTSGISQKDYLQKYLTGKNADKKRKKRKISKKATEKRSVIVDDDEIKTMRELADGELDIFSMSEDAPQIAGIIDERPEELRTIETFRSSARWKVISDEHGIEDIQVVAVPSEARPSADSDDDLSPARNTRDDSDESPPRKQTSPPRSKGRNISDSDESPPRVKSQSLGKQPRNGNDDSRWGKRESKGVSPLRRQRGEDADRSSNSRRDRGHSGETSSQRRGGSPLDGRQTSESRLQSDRRKTNRRLEDAEKVSKTKGTHSHSEASHQAKEGSQMDVVHGDRGGSFLPIRIKNEPVSPLRRDAGDTQHRNTAQRSSRKDISCDSENSDEPFPRKHHKKTVSKEFVNKSRSSKHKRSAGHDSDESPPRKSKMTSREIADEPSRKSSRREDLDESPPRKSKMTSREISDEPSRKSSRREDSDESPPRKSKMTSRKNANDSRKSSKHSREDSDESPPRKSKVTSRENANESKKCSKHPREDSYNSPPRRSKVTSRGMANEPSRKSSKHAREDSDESPPRKSKTTSRENANECKKSSRHVREDSDESPPRKSKMTSKEFGDEASSKGRRDVRQDPTKSSTRSSSRASRVDGSGRSEGDRTTDLKMGESGVQTAPIYRDRKTGRKRDLAAEEQQRREESAKLDVTKEKYTRWGAGLTQVAERESRIRDALREASKPVARFADDADLDAMLRARDREGDPMLEYLRGKSTDVSVPSKVRYVGSFPPNRYGIAPGHRWDGVDRSTGFERRWFEGAAARQAVAEDAYKWSVADM